MRSSTTLPASSLPIARRERLARVLTRPITRVPVVERNAKVILVPRTTDEGAQHGQRRFASEAVHVDAFRVEPASHLDRFPSLAQVVLAVLSRLRIGFLAVRGGDSNDLAVLVGNELVGSVWFLFVGHCSLPHRQTFVRRIVHDVLPEATA